MPQVVIPDMSVAARAGQGMPAPVNLLTTANQGAQLMGQRLANQDLTNRLTMFGSQQAGARDFANSLGPNGMVDPASLNRNLAADPQAYLAMPALSQQGMTNQATQTQISGQQLAQRIEKAKAMGDAYGAWLADPNRTRASLVRTITNTGLNFDTPKELANVVTRLSGVPDNQLDTVARGAVALARGAQGVAMHPAFANLGGQTAVFNDNSLAPGGIREIGTVGNSLSPGQAATPQTVVVNGQPVSTTTGQIAAHGYQLPTGASSNGPVGGGTVAEAPTVGSGRGASPATPAEDSGWSSTVAGLTPSQDAGQKGIGASDAVQLAEWQKYQTQIPAMMTTIRNGMAEASKFPTGPLGASASEAAALVSQLGLPNNMATAGALLQKGTAQQVVQTLTGGEMGAGTNDKLSLALMQTPNISQPGVAYQALGGIKLGTLAYDQALNRVAMQDGVSADPVAFAQFRQKWAQRFSDPMVFMLQYMPRGVAQTYLTSLTPLERKAFGAEYSDAKKNGLIPPAQGATDGSR